MGTHGKVWLLSDTVIYNTFVWMQLFNEINCRKLDGEFVRAAMGSTLTASDCL